MKNETNQIKLQIQKLTWLLVFIAFATVNISAQTTYTEIEFNSPDDNAKSRGSIILCEIPHYINTPQEQTNTIIESNGFTSSYSEIDNLLSLSSAALSKTHKRINKYTHKKSSNSCKAAYGINKDANTAFGAGNKL